MPLPGKIGRAFRHQIVATEADEVLCENPRLLIGGRSWVSVTSSAPRMI